MVGSAGAILYMFWLSPKPNPIRRRAAARYRAVGKRHTADGNASLSRSSARYRIALFRITIAYHYSIVLLRIANGRRGAELPRSAARYYHVRILTGPQVNSLLLLSSNKYNRD